MHGCENRKRFRRMLSLPSSVDSRGVIASVGDSVGSSLASPPVKDIRKINIGDCALFKPPEEAPPFIGVIRSLGSDKETSLQLTVTWLYRPADVQLLKGVAVEAAPNEVFYSFHRDEIPAASLLHLCKVAFLPKGVELPSGISSYVCRRVYDTKNKRLWWLTEKDFLNGRKEEVIQLLDKTQIEMHATIQQQQGGRSTKQVNSPRSASQLKHSPDSVHNSAPFSTRLKGKKRERSDQGTDPVKRERSLIADDGDFNVLRSEVLLKSEITKITEKGGLVDFEAVERLVQLMQQDKPDRKIDITCRSLLAGVIAATDKDNCLDQFVQLRGLPILDGWLQEVHKGKVGDSSSPRDHDKSVEDFLLSLLCALDRLPVNLNALQMCNIGKSVNLLRSHKNSDIQKKAKILVDTWKKRVEAEMNINDSRSTSQGVSWAAKTRQEGSHGGSKHTSISDATRKNFSSQLSSSKSAPAKVIQGEVIAKSASAPTAIGKLPSSPASTCAKSRESLRKTSVISGMSELPKPAVKDEKGSSSSQSLSNSHCSRDHVNNMGSSVKEDASSSNSGSTKLNKSCGSVSRRKKGANGLKGVAVSTVQQEGGSFKNSILTTSASEKVLQPSTSEKIGGVPVVENNNHKLIVKISNRSHSPALNVNGGPSADHLLMNSRASSPAVPELVAQSDCSLKENINGYQNNAVSDMNTESWQSNNLKDGGITCDEGDGSPAAEPDSGCSADEAGKLTDLAKAVSASQTELTSRKLHDSSLNSIDALIESCVKYSAATAPLSAGDVVGMNLLASVATGEMSKSSVASPSHSPQRSSSVAEESSRDYNVNSKPNGNVDVGVGEPNQSIAAGDVQGQKQNISSGASIIPNKKQGDQLTSLGKCKLPSGDPCLRSREKSYESEAPTSVSPATCTAGNEVTNEVDESVPPAQYDIHVCTPHISQGVASCMSTEVKDGDGTVMVDNQLPPVEAGSISSADVDANNAVKNSRECKAIVELMYPAIKATESLVKIEKAAVSCINNLLPGQFNDFKEDDVELGSGRLFNQLSNKMVKLGNDDFPPPKKRDESMSRSRAFDEKMNSSDVDMGNIVNPICSTPQMNSISPAQDKELLSKSKDSKLPTRDAVDLEELRPCVNDFLPATGSSGADGKLEFDLNEGFDANDCKDDDLPHMTSPQLSSNLPPFSVVSTSVSLPSSVTVAAAAKGPFVPPEDLLRNKGGLGWKGSAATSAFRPTEPRKVSEMPSWANNLHNCDVHNGKRSCARLEIDLNVADETSLEDMEGQSTDFKNMDGDGFGINNRRKGVNSGRNFGGLDLDLNRADEAPDIGHPPPVGHRFALPFQQIKMPCSGALFSSDSGCRDFDLNDGPTADEATVDVLSLNQHLRANFPSHPPVGFRISGPEMGGLNQWYPARTSLSAVPVPAPWEHPFAVAGTGGGPPRMLGGPGGAMPFYPDMYRGSVLSTSPAPPFTGSPYPYPDPVFPFGTSFPLSSSSLQGGSTAFMDLSSGGRLCVPAVPSQLPGCASNAPSQYPRPYMFSVSDVGNNGAVDNTRKSGGQGLDLNAGPGAPGLEGRDEMLPILPRPSSTMGSLTLTDEQSRMYAMAGGIMKRKEPEGGWDSDRLGYKQPSWQ